MSRIAWSAVEALHAGGWEPLPLRYRTKQPVPAGTTGEAGRALTLDQLRAAHRAGRFGGVAVRFPAGVVGVDVDAHKPGRDLTRWQKVAEHAPPTYRVWNRPTDPVSGTYLYRAAPPAGMRWVGTAGAIDTLHRGHRYQLAPPTEHPDGDRRYGVLAPDGWPVDGLPPVDMLPPLTVDAVAMLIVPDPARGAPRVIGEHEDRVGRDPGWCARVVNIWERVDLSGATPRHVTFNRAIYALWAAHGDGHRGALSALDRLEGEWMAHLGPVRGDTTAAGEWQRMSDTARRRWAVGAWPGPSCRCGRWGSTGRRFGW